jgi:RHH-type proline utilization regulon transcriptional repressor/proline dehydrogenase/delta 1-pyrroline-5-carboxylate dehydrogenase
MTELVPRVSQLAHAARDAGIGISIDAEEADRLDLSLDVIEAVARDPGLAGWDGFGVVVQAYSRRAGAVIDWLGALAETLDRRFMVRLVKGAYWDTEIKRAQVEGLEGFPVFTRKAATDVSYIACARKLLDSSAAALPAIRHPQCPHHGRDPPDGGRPARRVRVSAPARHGRSAAPDRARRTRHPLPHLCPRGRHRDLLAYLVRRLLENGANSSFVNQVLDASTPAASVARDPFAAEALGQPHACVASPRRSLCAGTAQFRRGIRSARPRRVGGLRKARATFDTTHWTATPILALDHATARGELVRNPARPDDCVGTVTLTAPADLDRAIASAQPWSAPAPDRAATLNRAADLYETHAPELFALLAREAGKTSMDAVSELREAVDFLRYYAARAPELTHPPRGPDHLHQPMELPARHLHRPDRRCTGRGQCGACQTCRGHAAGRRAGNGAASCGVSRTRHCNSCPAWGRRSGPRSAPIQGSTASPSPGPPRQHRRSTAPWPPTFPRMPR